MLTLKGTTASLTINGAFALSFGYNAGTVDGAIGLLSRGGTTSADSFRIRTSRSRSRTRPSPRGPRPSW